MRLLLIFGPPAVGKMTVGREVAARTDFRLFHNHHTIEPLLEVFGWGTPPFRTLNDEFRGRVFEEAAAHDVDLIFTVVWDLSSAEDAEVITQYIAPYVDRGADVLFVELAADLDTRLDRNRGESRLAHKPSKRDLDWSDGNVRELEAWVMNTTLEPSRAELDEIAPARAVIKSHPHLRLDTAGLSAGESADLIAAWVTDR